MARTYQSKRGQSTRAKAPRRSPSGQPERLPTSSRKRRSAFRDFRSKILRAAGIPCGKIQSVGEVCEDPQIIARDMVVTVEHPKAGAVRVTGVPVKLSDTPGAVTLPPPLLGGHTAQVLTEWLQMSAAEVDHLRQAGAL